MQRDDSPNPQNTGQIGKPTPIQEDSFLRQAVSKNTGLVPALRESVENLEHLRSYDTNQIRQLLNERQSLSDELRKSLELLEQLSLLAQKEMGEMNAAHPGLPPDSLETTLDLVTRKGASVIVIYGRQSADLNEQERVLGYGIMISGSENFPESAATDPSHRIPASIYNGASSEHRLIRLFVSDSAREQEASGKALDLIINRVKEIASGGRIIAMVLTDIMCLESKPDQSFDITPWLMAKSALAKRGFEDSGFTLTETVARNDAPSIAITFKWWAFPPSTEHGRLSYQALQKRYERLEARQRERLAGISSELPISGAKVLHIGTQLDAFDLARISGNQVYGVTFGVSQRPVRRANLVTLPYSPELSLPEASLDAVVINGVLPDITKGLSASAGRSEIENFIQKWVASLKEGGSLLIRDTIAPKYTKPLHLYLKLKDATQPNDEAKAPADLFDEFIKTKSEKSISAEEWQAVQRLSDEGEFACYKVPAKVAAEFQLKFLYWQDWANERDRPYTSQTAHERVDLCKRLGLRLVYAAPERSSFIHQRQKDEGIFMRSLSGDPIDPFCTNHLSIWQRVAPSEGSDLISGDLVPIGNDPFVKIACYDEIDELGQVKTRHEVASRRGDTIDIIPIKVDKEQGKLYVWGRVSSRPIPLAHAEHDETIHGGYVNEQLAGIVREGLVANPMGVAAASRALFERLTNTSNSHELRLFGTSRYFVRPETIDEMVTATAIEAPDLPLKDIQVPYEKAGLDPAFTLRAFEASHILQAAQIGHRRDARLERKVYQLLIENKFSCGPWIGARTEIETQSAQGLKSSTIAEVLGSEVSAEFKRSDDQRPNLLALYKRKFTERVSDQSASEQTCELEYVEPAPETGLSYQSVSILPVVKIKGVDGAEEILVGLTLKALPAIEAKLGSSKFITVPTARVTQSTKELNETVNYAKDALVRDYGVSIRSIAPLGGKYLISPGITPETITPYLAEIDLSNSATHSFLWVSLKDLISSLPKFQCAQLITSAYRLAHMQRLLEAR